MQVIKEHIKSKNFKPFYLLYGSEDYLKKLYKDKLRSAILQDGNEMNYSYYEGKDINLKKVSEDVQTLPFFSNKRLIIIENSGLFKVQNELSETLSNIPESTIVLFIEAEIDKRNKLYKMIKDQGTVSEMNGLDEKNLKLFVVSMLEQNGKRITESMVSYILEKTGTDMETIRSEMEKVICYTMDHDVITQEDIDAVVTTQITGKIFAMIDAIAGKQQNKAFSMYYDLLHLREKPLTILFLITRHFNILLQVKNLTALGHNSSSISEKVGIPPFAVSKYNTQTRNFTVKQLKEALEFSAEVEEQIKNGRLAERIGVELFIVTFSSKEAI